MKRPPVKVLAEEARSVQGSWDLDDLRTSAGLIPDRNDFRKWTRLTTSSSS